jgi:hypothetical protein
MNFKIMFFQSSTFSYDILCCCQNLSVKNSRQFDFGKYKMYLNQTIIIGWTEWTRFNETNQIRHRKCSNETFGQAKGLQVLIQIIIFQKRTIHNIS